MEILGVRIDNFSKKEILEKIELFLTEENFHQIATVNPEFILEAQKNDTFKSILNECDLNIADGVGLKYAFWRYGKHLKKRFSGADLMQEVLRIANNKKMKVFLAVSGSGLSKYEEIRNALNIKYPNIDIEGKEYDTHHSSTVTSHWEENNMSDRLQITDDCILLCNFGSPYQEEFINSQKNAKIRLAMGIGGSLDYITNKRKRAPLFLRFIGLEWLWRLMLEPKYRLKRVFNAVCIFPSRIIFKR
jgi:N-acetylglucosaminyldiphosphoundecaprenol N-acetyl-beta-D-mannosaminyltransferase